MRKGLVFAVIALVLAGGLGIAAAQLGDDDPPLDLELPDPATTTTTTMLVAEAQPETIAPAEPSPPAEKKQSPAPSPPPTRPAPSLPPVTQPPGGSTSSPPLTTPPTSPGSPYEPAPDPYQPKSQLVQPRPGMENLHPSGWERVEVLGESRIRVHFVSGVEPCSVLDHVDVDYGPAAIVVTLYEGSDPTARNTACIMIAMYKAVDINLSQPIGGRQIVDGAG